MKRFILIAAVTAASQFSMPAVSPVNAETTLCTEITALPITITVQGVYCLKQNLNVNLATGNAITINAGNVTIDFNGFRVNNQAQLASTEALGLYARDRKNVTVRNGFIRGFIYGIWLDEETPGASGAHLVEGMKIADSGRIGVFVKGSRSVIRSNRIFDTGGSPNTNAYGILVFADEALIADNVISGVSETFAGYGIAIEYSNSVRVTANEVTDVITGSCCGFGVSLDGVNGAIITNNVLLNNPSSGTVGIEDKGVNSNDITCFGNAVGGYSFAVPLRGCDNEYQNRKLFN